MAIEKAPRAKPVASHDPRATAGAWKQFLDAGMLWWVNRILHTFGWSIVVVIDVADGAVVDAYPARTAWLGFTEDTNEAKLAAFRAHLMGEDEPAVIIEMDGDMLIYCAGCDERTTSATHIAECPHG